jgi:hypothetical protein
MTRFITCPNFECKKPLRVRREEAAFLIDAIKAAAGRLSPPAPSRITEVGRVVIDATIRWGVSPAPAKQGPTIRVALTRPGLRGRLGCLPWMGVPVWPRPQ